MSASPPRPMLRVLVALVALVALAWLGVSLRGYDLYERGERLAFAEGASPAQVDEAARLLEDARFLNPDTRPQLTKGALLASRGDARERREGLELLEEVARDEPDNVLVWGVIASVTRRLDPERSRAARARGSELSPPVPAD